MQCQYISVHASAFLRQLHSFEHAFWQSLLTWLMTGIETGEFCVISSSMMLSYFQMYPSGDGKF